jgi:two-component sensor histidine kinase
MNGSFLRTTWAYWVCQFGGWGGVAALGWILDALQRISSSPSVRQDHFFLPLTCITGLIATHLLRAVIKQGQWLEMTPARIIFRYAAALLITALFLSCVGTLLFASPPVGESRTETFTVALLANSSLVGAWMAIYFLLHFYEGLHAAQAERALLKEAYTGSQLEALRLQLNPHFLFNALNTIRALMPPSSQEAREALTKLAETLRVTLASSEEMTIPLKRELSVVRDYLGIEKLRFGDHLEIIEAVSPETLDAAIPPLLLLTIVENAIKHGVQHHEEGGTLTISSSREENEIIISVLSPGGVSHGENSVSFGIGLRNVRERLKLIFGEKTSADLFTESAQHTECILRFPWSPMSLHVEKRSIAS